jgi:uncharacterized protein YbjT (DUF2867 family)
VRILVTGATGYVGGRLVPRLLAAGHSVRALARDPARLAGRSWAGAVEVARGDVLRAETLAPALAGIDVAYYLVHAMGAAAGFEQRDVAGARAFGQAARAAGVGRIVYLGGLGDDAADDLSAHLASRHATGDALREGGVPVTELRAAVIVGSGSVSFEIVRYLTERLPLMICPRWVYRRTQPIAVRDVLAYLVAALDAPESAGKVVEIGGADVLTYAEMILGYARARRLRRVLLPVPVLTPRLSSHWVHWVTPIPKEIAQPLIEGLRSEVVVRTPLARELFPAIRPLSYDEALRAALAKLDAGALESRWTDALATSQRDGVAVALETREGLVAERREVVVAAPPEATFAVFSGLGGERGWLAGNFLWRVRGALDRLLGGVGLRRGRRHPDELRVGDALDFWRVEAVEAGRLVRLRAEMRVPGRAWLELEALPAPGGSRLVQTAFFAPRGLAGLAYWWVLYPVHAVIFSLLARRIAARAEARAGAAAPAAG